jgi:hypothetical protein
MNHDKNTPWYKYLIQLGNAIAAEYRDDAA